jgi:AraC-like DNA-binding protein
MLESPFYLRDRPKPFVVSQHQKTMDPLSDVLALLKPRSYVARGFDVGGDLSIQFPRHEGIKCYAMQSGQMWIVIEDLPNPVLIRAGDCFMLPSGRSFCLTTDLALPPVDYRVLITSRADGNIAVFNGGGSGAVVGGHFALSGNARILLDQLPPIVHLRSETDKATLRWSIERMMEELRNPQPGGVLVAQQLAYMMLVQALRLHMAEGLDGGVGWLFALADKQMSAAITAIHADPAHRWTLHGLAETAGMSRSTFALRFKETVGKSPMDYLTHWRMLLAADRLAHTGDSVSAIALSLGYESESAFSTAFKRVMGNSPRRHTRLRVASTPHLTEIAVKPLGALSAA